MTDTTRKFAPILLIEDDRDTRDAIRALLNFDGHAVVTASDATDALNKLRGGLQPCLVLLDLMLPRLDGFRFRSQQVRDPVLAPIPVVVYSGRQHMKPQAALLGVAPYFEEPLDFDSLLDLVAAHCASGGG
jgi:two-component system, chemotaxis family, chemotaxis protein CheY